MANPNTQTCGEIKTPEQHLMPELVTAQVQYLGSTAFGKKPEFGTEYIPEYDQ